MSFRPDRRIRNVSSSFLGNAGLREVFATGVFQFLSLWASPSLGPSRLQSTCHVRVPESVSVLLAQDFVGSKSSHESIPAASSVDHLPSQLVEQYGSFPGQLSPLVESSTPSSKSH